MIHLSVFDASGRRVREILSGEVGSGGHTVNWDGLDERGASVPAGAYFVRLDAPGHRMVRRAVVVR